MKEPLIKVTHYETVESEPLEMKTIKQYETYGIKVLVMIDRRTKTATLVEYDDKDKKYKPKKWLFQDRTGDYMNGWIAIFRACEQAVIAAKAELEKFDDDELQKMLDMHVALNKMLLEDGNEATE